MCAKCHPPRFTIFPAKFLVFAAVLCTIAVSAVRLSAQSGVISSDSLTPFDPRDVGAVSEVKTVRIRLNRSLAITAVAITQNSTEFSAGAITGCTIDGRTINPAFTVCEVPVTFQPKYPGLRTAPLVVTDNTGTKYSIGLVGTGLASQAALTPGIITTIAGIGISGYTGDGGPAINAWLAAPTALSIDTAGNLYFVDNYYYGFIRKIDTNGIITKVAGSEGYAPSFSGDGGLATSAHLAGPSDLAVDAAGNLYIADTQNNRIRKIDLNGIITTVAGNGNQGFSGDNGPATSAALSTPSHVVLDRRGNLYITDASNNRIRTVDRSGIITTFAGNGSTGFSGDHGSATRASITSPGQIAVDAAGNLYLADGSLRIRKVDVNGEITTVAGRGTAYSYDNGPATHAGVDPDGIALDRTGNLFTSDEFHARIRKIDVSHSAAAFGAQSVGTISPNQRIVLTNIGNQHLDLGTLTITGAFDSLSSADPSYCSSAPDMGPGFSCALPIAFSPTDAGSFTGTATITDNSLNQPGTTQSLSLTGSGINH